MATFSPKYRPLAKKGTPSPSSRTRPNRTGTVTLIALNKPFDVLCQFQDEAGRDTLQNYVKQPDVYPCGRLDRDSEGLLLLSNHGPLQAFIAEPSHKMEKEYWVQVEGAITDDALAQLSRGVELKDGKTKPAKAKRITPTVWARVPPVRERKSIPTSWLSLTITEGRNRQVRRMTAHVGFPTLRLIRVRIGDWSLDDLQVGETKRLTVPDKFAKPSAQTSPRPAGTKPKSALTKLKKYR